MNRFFVIAATLIAMTSAGAFAQEPSDAEIRAFNLYKDAQTMMEQSRWDEAVDLLDQAQAAFPMPQIAFQRARCLQARGDLADALAALDAIQTDEAKLKGKIDKLRAELTDAMATPIEIDVTSNAEQVKMIVDGNGVFFVPGKIAIAQGQHRIEYSAPGFKPKSEDRVIGAFDTDLDIRLDPVGGKVVLRTDLDSFWGMVVKIDDMELNPSGTSMTPNQASPIEIPAGAHTYTCSKAGYPDYTGSFSLVSTQFMTVECLMTAGGTTTKKAATQSNPWKWVFLGVGGGMTVAGTGLMGWYFYNKANLPAGQVIQKDYYEGWIGLGLAGVGIAMAVMGFFIFPDKDIDEGQAAADDTRYGFSVVPMQDGAAASFALTF